MDDIFSSQAFGYHDVTSWRHFAPNGPETNTNLATLCTIRGPNQAKKSLGKYNLDGKKYIMKYKNICLNIFLHTGFEIKTGKVNINHSI